MIPSSQTSGLGIPPPDMKIPYTMKNKMYNVDINPREDNLFVADEMMHLYDFQGSNLKNLVYPSNYSIETNVKSTTYLGTDLIISGSGMDEIAFWNLKEESKLPTVTLLYSL